MLLHWQMCVFTLAISRQWSPISQNNVAQIVRQINLHCSCRTLQMFQATGGDNLQCPSRATYSCCYCYCTSVAHGPWLLVSLSGGTLVGADQISTGSRGTAMPITRFEHPSSIGDCAAAAADDREGGTRNARPPCKNMCVEQLVAGRPLASSLDHLPKFWCRDISLSRLVAWPQYLDEVFRKIVPWWGWKQGRQACMNESLHAASGRGCSAAASLWLLDDWLAHCFMCYARSSDLAEK